MPLLYAIAAAARVIISDFMPQGLSNLVWAFATLEFIHQPLLEAISSAALPKIWEFDVQELSNTSWAFSFSGYLHLNIVPALRGVAIVRGRKMDQEKVPGDRWSLCRNIIDVTGLVATPFDYEVPSFVVHTPGLVVIFKPSGWETDVYDVAKFGVPITPVARFYLLSTFIGSKFSKHVFPICHSAEHGFGFVHRLDQMSSGLIIAATKFETHFCLQWQMSCYLIEREYFVLCHGFAAVVKDFLRINARILEGKIRARSTFGERCRVSSRGKPAVTQASPTSHLRLFRSDSDASTCTLSAPQRVVPGGERLSSVAVAIVTGRQHQIRVHMQLVGHPTVYDGRYVHQDIVLRWRSNGLDLPRSLKLAGQSGADRQNCFRLRPLPDKHRAELTLRGAYPWR